MWCLQIIQDVHFIIHVFIGPAKSVHDLDDKVISKRDFVFCPLRSDDSSRYSEHYDPDSNSITLLQRPDMLHVNVEKDLKCQTPPVTPHTFSIFHLDVRYSTYTVYILFYRISILQTSLEKIFPKPCAQSSKSIRSVYQSVYS